MTQKLRFLLQRGIPSLVGWLKYLARYPRAAMILAWLRCRYFLTEKLAFPLRDPEGFLIDDERSLVHYWSLLVEEELHHETWVSALQKASRPLVLDIGANFGVFTHLARVVNPNCRVIAFEPQPELADRINAYARTSAADIRCIAAAASDQPGKLSLHFKDVGDTFATLLPAGQGQGQTRTVDVITIDSIAASENPLLVKIDTEGHEMSVLQGARQTLTHTSFLIIEAHTGDAFRQISEFLGNKWCSVRLGSTDYLFINSQLQSSEA